MYKVGIVGATGVVGRELIEVMRQRAFPIEDLKLFASSDSRGTLMAGVDEPLVVQDLEATDEPFEGLDLVFFTSTGEVSRRHVPAALEAGAVVIDNSSAFRRAPAVPLVVPEINWPETFPEPPLFANPNCSTALLMMALAPLARVAGLRRLWVATYQSVSGAGRAAMDELFEQTLAIARHQTPTPEVFPRQIAFNLIPLIGPLNDEGWTEEEDKLVHETRKILGLPGLAVSSTCVRVPTFIGHAEAVTIETDRPLAVEEAAEILETAPGVRLVLRVEEGLDPLAATGTDDVLVGRLRRDSCDERILHFFVVGDNLRRGAALNALRIAEKAFQ